MGYQAALALTRTADPAPSIASLAPNTAKAGVLIYPVPGGGTSNAATFTISP
ncbi:MAG: hypothetical protein ACE5IP_06700 [Terriglobia bacterium]